MLVADGGGGGAMYAVQIESLEEFQQKLTTILMDLEANNNVMSLGDGASTYGNFPEGQSFATAYEQAKQDLINTFNEVTQLVNTMISVAGANAAKYKQTEQDITAKFNSILQQYGDTPTTPSTSGTTYQPDSTTTTGTTTTGTTAYATQADPNTPASDSGTGGSGSSDPGSSDPGTSNSDSGTDSGGSSSSSSTNAAGNAA